MKAAIFLYILHLNWNNSLKYNTPFCKFPGCKNKRVDHSIFCKDCLKECSICYKEVLNFNEYITIKNIAPSIKETKNFLMFEALKGRSGN